MQVDTEANLFFKKTKRKTHFGSSSDDEDESAIRRGSKKRTKRGQPEENPFSKVFLVDKRLQGEKNEKKRLDVVFEYAHDKDALKRKEANVIMASFMAIDLYLEPLNVYPIVFHWISQYVNYKKPEKYWFVDHIRNIIKYPIRLSMTSSRGIAHTNNTLKSSTFLVSFAGSDLHKLSSELFTTYLMDKVLMGLKHFILPENKSFLVQNTLGLKGEIEVASFLYNKVLSFFYEPSFYIVTSYFIYIEKLTDPKVTKGRHVRDYLPSIRRSMLPLIDYDIEIMGCLDRENSNYEEKLVVFKSDMKKLYDILDTTDIRQMNADLKNLWSERASDASYEIGHRLDIIYSQLYGNTKIES